MKIKVQIELDEILQEVDLIRKESTDPIVIGLCDSIEDFLGTVEKNNEETVKALNTMMKRLKGQR